MEEENESNLTISWLADRRARWQHDRWRLAGTLLLMQEGEQGVCLVHGPGVPPPP